MDINQGINLKVEEGEKVHNPLLNLYALSTCGHCRRAIEFLKENKVSFAWVHIDKIPFERKQQLKKDLKDMYNKRVAFPFLVINEKKAVVGFIRSEYEALLG